MEISCPFDVIIITAPNERSAHAYQTELEVRVRRRYPAQAQLLILLSVSDPKGKRVGSGGGTLNALHHVVKSAGPASSSSPSPRILMIHSGGDSQRSPTNSVCGKAWSALNSVSDQSSSCNTPIDLMLEQMCSLFQGIPTGSMVVASSDVLLILPTSLTNLGWSMQGGVTGLASQTALELGPNHGVYVTEEQGKAGGRVVKYMQKASMADLKANGATSSSTEQVQIDTGVIYFSPEATDALISLLDKEPFRGCTVEGVETGSEVLRLELYSDMLLAFSGGVGQSYEQYLSMDGGPPPRLFEARQALWKLLGSLPFYALTPEESRFGHLGTTAELLEMMTLKMEAFAEAYHLRPHACCLMGLETKDEGAIILNSIIERGTGALLEEDAVLEHSLLQGQVGIGRGALVSGLCFSGARNISVRPGICVQEIRLGHLSSSQEQDKSPRGGPAPWALPPQSYVLTLLAVKDPIKAIYTDLKARVWGLPWNDILEPLNISIETIWPCETVAPHQRSIWTARLFPLLSPSDPDSNAAAVAWWMQDLACGIFPSSEVLGAWTTARRLSLSEILTLAEPETEFEWRRILEHEVLGRRSAARKSALKEIQESLLAGPIPERGGRSLDDIWGSLADTSDRVYLIEKIEEWLQTSSQGWSTSTLASTFALLSRMFRHTSLLDKRRRGVGGAFTLSSEDEVMMIDMEEECAERWGEFASALEKAGAERCQACATLLQARHSWTGPLSRSNLASSNGWALAARNYELIALQFVRDDVASAREGVVVERVPKLEAGQSVVAEAPARTDLAGGWSDTPPISYEMGGEVTNIAIKIDGKRPIGVTVSRIEDKVIILQAKQANGSITELVCDELEAFQDLEAGSPTALLKCTIVYCGIIDIKKQGKSEEEESLANQLGKKLGFGLKVYSRSDVPTGSGLGTSSILAGTILAAVGRACGQHYNIRALNHAVLMIEQMMGVGGGWQDQVGGLVGGIKRAYSPAGLPLRVEFEKIPISKSTKALLESHLLLIYTGKQRLARDMVHNVLRRYHGRHPQVLNTITALVRNAKDAAQAIKDGDVVKLGACLSRYWQEKKIMAGEGGGGTAAASSSSSSTCEPPHVKQLMEALAPHALGMSLMGAGGGGYLLLVTREPLEQDPPTSETNDLLTNIVHDGGIGRQVSRIQIDEEGLALKVV